MSHFCFYGLIVCGIVVFILARLSYNDVISISQVAVGPREAVDAKYGGFFWFFKPIVCIEIFRGRMSSACIIPFFPWREKYKLRALGCDAIYHCPSGEWNECLSLSSAPVFCDSMNKLMTHCLTKPSDFSVIGCNVLRVHPEPDARH